MNYLFIIFVLYIKMTNNYYQKHKKVSKQKHLKDMKIFLKKKKIKGKQMPKKVTKFNQRRKK